MMKKDDKLDVLLELVKHSTSKEQAISHVIMFARNEDRRNPRRSLEYYVDMIMKIVKH